MVKVLWDHSASLQPQHWQPPVLPSVPLYTGGHSGNLAHSPACCWVGGGGISLPWDPPPSPSCLCFTPPQAPSVTLQVLPRQAEQISCRQLLFPSGSRSSNPARPQTSALPLPPTPSKLKCWSPCLGNRAALREVEPCS